MKISFAIFTAAALLCIFTGCAKFDADEAKTVVSTPNALVQENGTETQIAEKTPVEWPTEGLAATLPLPDFEEVILSQQTETYLEVIIIGETVDTVKEYLNAVRDFGYDVNEDLSENDILGVPVCSFTAENEYGYIFNLKYTAGVCTFTVTSAEN